MFVGTPHSHPEDTHAGQLQVLNLLPHQIPDSERQVNNDSITPQSRSLVCSLPNIFKLQNQILTLLVIIIVTFTTLIAMLKTIYTDEKFYATEAFHQKQIRIFFNATNATTGYF